jgi:hypothetical protein
LGAGRVRCSGVCRRQGESGQIKDSTGANSSALDAPERLLSDSEVRETQIQIQFDQFGGQKNKKETYSIDLDRAHNLVLDRLVAYGGLNAFSWIVLYFFPIFYYLKTSFNDFRVKKKYSVKMMEFHLLC